MTTFTRNDPNGDTFGWLLSAPETGPADYRHCQLFTSGDLINSFGLYGIVTANSVPGGPVAVTFDGKTISHATPDCLDLIGRYCAGYAREW
jgi:hypothetical protein